MSIYNGWCRIHRDTTFMAGHVDGRKNLCLKCLTIENEAKRSADLFRNELLAIARQGFKAKPVSLRFRIGSNLGGTTLLAGFPGRRIVGSQIAVAGLGAAKLYLMQPEIEDEIVGALIDSPGLATTGALILVGAWVADRMRDLPKASSHREFTRTHSDRVGTLTDLINPETALDVYRLVAVERMASKRKT